MVLRLKIGLNSPAPFILFLNLSTEHALSTAHGYSKNMMLIDVSDYAQVLLPIDSLLIRCACVRIGAVFVQAHHP